MISVIVPVYNVENYLRRCLDSILAQSYTAFEIICVDDCGKDSSMDIVRQYREKYPDKIRIIESRKNTGLGGARDKGIAAASGEYLAFLDSDDSIRPDYLEQYMRKAEETGADIVAGGSIRVTGMKQETMSGMPEDPWYCWVNVSAWAKIFRTAFLKDNGIDFRGVRTYEDAPFIFRCLAQGPKMAIIPYEGYLYYQNPGSITTSRKTDRLHLFKAYEKNIIDVYRNTVFREADREIAVYCLASQLITNLLFNGQHAGLSKMGETYRDLDGFLRELDPQLAGNRFISRSIPLSEPNLNRLATWIVLKARKIRADRMVFQLVSILPKLR